MASNKYYIKMVQNERDNDQKSLDTYRTSIREANKDLRNSIETWLDNISFISITLGAALIPIGVSFSADKKFHHPRLFWAGLATLISNGFIIIIWKKVITEFVSPKIDLIGIEEQYLLTKKKQLENDIIDGTKVGVDSYKKFLSSRVEYIKIIKEKYNIKKPSKKLEIRTDVALYLLFIGVLMVSASALRNIKPLEIIIIVFTVLDAIYVIYTINQYFSSKTKRKVFTEKVKKIGINALDKEIKKSKDALELLNRNHPIKG